MGLFAPKWMTRDNRSAGKALAAVGRVNDQAQLIEIARKAPLKEVRQAALERLSQESLVSVFLDERMSDDVRRDVLARIDQGHLLSIVTERTLEWDVRDKAFGNLSQGSLVSLAYDENSESNWRGRALAYIEDVAAIERIVLDESLRLEIRHSALDNLTDDAALERIAMNGSVDMKLRAIVVDRLQDGFLVARIGAADESMFYTSALKLRGMKDWKSFRWLCAHAQVSSLYSAYNCLAFGSDPVLFQTLEHDASSFAIRRAAKGRQLEVGEYTPALQSFELDLVRDMVVRCSPERRTAMEVIEHLEQARCDDPEPDVRGFLHACLIAIDDDSAADVAEFLALCEDPVGMAIEPLWAAALKEECLSDAELEAMLEIDEDYALNYLMTFAKTGYGADWARRVKMSSRAIWLMHSRGHAVQRIESELPRRKRYSYECEYQDSENDIRYKTEEFEVVFWG